MSLRPFLKWVGGKRQLLPVLRRFYPEPAGRYFEPFLGSGAVFFDLTSRGRLNGHGATLSDDNADLIACYRRIGRSLDEVIAGLERLAADHAVRGRECYMQVRDEHFNPLRAAWRDRGADLDDYPADLAAMLIYLNRTGYNGLFRLNASGEFNVPPGRYDRPKVLDRPLLTQVYADPGARPASSSNMPPSIGPRTPRRPVISSISIRRTARRAPPPTFAATPGAASRMPIRNACSRW